MKKLIAALLAVFMMVSLAACAGGGAAPAPPAPPAGGAAPPAAAADAPRQVFELNIPHSGLADSPREVAFAVMREEIRYAVDGYEIVLNTFPANVLGTTIEQIAGVQSGVFDMALQTIAHIGTFQPLAAVFDIPFMIPQDTEQHVEILLGDNEFMRLFKDSLREVGFEPIVPWHDGVGYWTASFPGSRPADFEGRLIRVMPSPMRVAMVEHMGGIMIAMDWMELYNALMTGAVEAQENPWHANRTAQFYEVQDYMIGTRHVPLDHMMIANPDWWATVPPEIQEAIRYHTTNAVKVSMDYLFGTHDVVSYEIMFGGDNPHMTLIYPTPEELAEWEAIHWLVRDDYLAMVGPRGQEFLDAFDDVYERVTGVRRVRPS